ncbi:MAG: N-acetylglucosamine kinase [Christensenellales bacterium]|jgi:N-acetylglucosamine kinase-like BadF-type ATPase
MTTFLSIDGGGSKCACVLYDSNMRLLGAGRSGGTNTTQNPPSVVRANIAKSLDEALKAAAPSEVEAFYYSIVGPADVLMEEVQKRVRVKHVFPMSEPVAGLYAGSLSDSGILAQAGTGSDIFWVRNGDRDFAYGNRTVVGSWGPILGDQGSGTWMGRMALLEFVKASEGWGEKTLLSDLIREEFGLKNDYDLVTVIHSDPAPFRKVASVTHLIGKAANMGDGFAKKILCDAGEVLARQAQCLIERNAIPEDERIVTCSGGAWNAHVLMFESFTAHLTKRFPEVVVKKPLFDCAMAGPVRILLERGLSKKETEAVIRARFPNYCIRW